MVMARHEMLPIVKNDMLEALQSALRERVIDTFVSERIESVTSSVSEVSKLLQLLGRLLG